jgi:F420-dependent oxidoreductase-like protein
MDSLQVNCSGEGKYSAHPNDRVNSDHSHEREIRMRLALMIEAQQGLTYDDQLAIVRRAEAAGFEAFFRSDHYTSFPGPAGHRTTDAWTVLAGLARDTQRISLGVLVSPVTFRIPGSFAKVVTTVDEMSGGRIEVGVGAGWNDDEHAQLGLPFPPIEVRAEMLEEELQILHGLWTAPDGWSFDGRHWQVRGAMFHPKPVHAPGRPNGRSGPRPRILVGGGGSPRSMRLAVRYADEFNVTSAGPAEVADKFRRLAEIEAEADRDPATLTRSAMVGVMVGADDAEVRRRRDALVSAIGETSDADEWFAERRERWIMGTPDEAREMITRFAAAGVERIMLQDFLPRDLEMIDLMGAELVGRA